MFRAQKQTGSRDFPALSTFSLTVCPFKGQRWSCRISLPCCWWLLVHYMYLPMRADRCIARGETSSRLKVQLVLHAHDISWTWFPPPSCVWHCSCLLSILPSLFSQVISYCLGRTDILLTAQLLDTVTCICVPSSTVWRLSAGKQHMQSSFHLVSTCLLPPTPF